MRLGILTQYYPPEIGAPQARLSELAQRFVARGHQVHVLTAMPNYPRGHVYPGYGGVFSREERDGVQIIRAYIYPTQSTEMVPRLSNYFSFVLSSVLTGALALPPVDYLLTESPPLFLGMTGYLLSRLKGGRWIFNVSDLWPESAVNLGVIGPGWSLRAAEVLEAFCYRKAWLVSGQSREILGSIQQRFPDVQTYHLSNGVDTHLFRPGLRDAPLREELSEGKACVAIYAGLHGIAQGLEQILEAAARLRDVDDLLFVFVGDGPEKEQLVKRSQALGLTNVRFKAPYPREAMPYVLAAADIALVPLKHRILGAVPSKMYEAMGAGLPVVLMADGEPAKIVREAQAGSVVAPGDAASLASVLRDLAGDPSRRQELGRAGRKAAKDRFDRQQINDAFIDHLEHMLGAPEIIGV